MTPEQFINQCRLLGEGTPRANPTALQICHTHQLNL